MKKAVIFLGATIVFSILGAMLDSYLGITFPNRSAHIAHVVFYLVNGGVIAIIIAKI